MGCSCCQEGLVRLQKSTEYDGTIRSWPRVSSEASQVFSPGRFASYDTFALNNQLGLVCPLHLPHEVLVQGHINKDLLSALSRSRCRATESAPELVNLFSVSLCHSPQSISLSEWFAGLPSTAPVWSAPSIREAVRRKSLAVAKLQRRLDQHPFVPPSIHPPPFLPLSLPLPPLTTRRPGPRPARPPRRPVAPSSSSLVESSLLLLADAWGGSLPIGTFPTDGLEQRGTRKKTTGKGLATGSGEARCFRLDVPIPR